MNAQNRFTRPADPSRTRTNARPGLMSVLTVGAVMALTAASGLAAPFHRAHGPAQRTKIAYHVERTSDGGFITVGAISTPTATGTFGPPDIYVSKTNFAGLLQWDRIIGGQASDIGYVVREVPGQQGYIIAAETTSVPSNVPGGLGIALVRIDLAGNFLGARVYQGTPTLDRNAGVSLVLQPEGFAVTGRIKLPNVAGDAGVFLRTTGTLAPITHLYYTDPTGQASPVPTFTDLKRVSTTTGGNFFGNFVISGKTLRRIDVPGTPGTINDDAWAMMIQPTGNVIWSNGYDPLYQTTQADLTERADAIHLSAAGYPILAGRSDHPGLTATSPITQGSFISRLQLATGLVSWWRTTNLHEAAVVGLNERTSDLKIVLAGLTRNANTTSASLWSLDNAGNSNFLHRYLNSNQGEGVTVDQPTNEFSMAGRIRWSTNTFDDVYHVRTTPAGFANCGTAVLTPAILRPETPAYPVALRPNPLVESITWSPERFTPSKRHYNLCGIVIGTGGAVVTKAADIANTDALIPSAFPSGDPMGGADGATDNGDFTAFFSAFFLEDGNPDRLVADIADTDADVGPDYPEGTESGGPDGVVDNGDFTAFFRSFFDPQ
ncbi:MAG: hypothetical protein ACK5ZN_01370 [Phycisphaerales bacterium]